MLVAVVWLSAYLPETEDKKVWYTLRVHGIASLRSDETSHERMGT